MHLPSRASSAQGRACHHSADRGYQIAAARHCFAALHGFGNGILTIARGTVPLAIYGPKNYGYRLGLLGAPARIAQAIAPLLFGVLVDRIGEASLIVSSALSIAALGCLMLVTKTHRPDPPTEAVS